MSWLTDWDPITHGTAVFGAAVPFLAALVLAWFFPRHLGLAVAGGAAISLLWVFGIPSIPPKSSDDAVVVGWAAALLGVLIRPWWGRAAFGIVGWFAIGWLFYPAWLAADGGVADKVGVALALAVSVTALGIAASGLAGGAKPRLGTAAFVPPGVALAVLLQLGGSTRFAQSAGALTAAITAICVVMVWRRAVDPAGRASGFWMSLVVFLAWCGWLFAEIRYGLAVLLLAAPLVAWAGRRLPLPRGKPWQIMLWDALGSAAVALPVAAVAVADYLADGASDGY